MITLFTGSPGAGKTASLVNFLSKLEVGDRPLFVDGLDGLTLPHSVVDANEWHTALPDGAILVIDEAQRVWRPRGVGSKVPLSVSELETHRHRGIDIFITTQSPKLLDSNVRGLIGRHVHIRDTGILGRYWYEWPECNDSMNWKSCINKRRMKLPKKAFSLYKSASLHTVPVRGVPRALIVGFVALLAFLVLGYGVYRIVAKTQVKEPFPVAPSLSSSSIVNASASPGAAVHVGYDLAQFIPVVSSHPESAPAYDQLRKVVVMPKVVGGYCVDGVCKCVNNQGTDARISNRECQDYVNNPPFDPYRVSTPSENVQRSPATVEPTKSSVIASS